MAGQYRRALWMDCGRLYSRIYFLAGIEMREMRSILIMKKLWGKRRVNRKRSGLRIIYNEGVTASGSTSEARDPERPMA